MKQKKSALIALAGLILLAIGLGIALTSVKKSQELRKKAAAPTGPAVLAVVPAGTSFPEGQSVELNLTATITSGIQIDGFQIFARLEGTIPDDIKLEPQTINKLQSIKAILTRDASGANLVLASILQDPAMPYRPSQSFIPAKLTFTAPRSGTMSIVFDQKRTKITERKTSINILTPLNDEQYSFKESEVTPTPMPTSAPVFFLPFDGSMTLQNDGYNDSYATTAPKTISLEGPFTLEFWVKPSLLGTLSSDKEKMVRQPLVTLTKNQGIGKDDFVFNFSLNTYNPEFIFRGGSFGPFFSILTDTKEEDEGEKDPVYTFSANLRDQVSGWSDTAMYYNNLIFSDWTYVAVSFSQRSNGSCFITMQINGPSYSGLPRTERKMAKDGKCNLAPGVVGELRIAKATDYLSGSGAPLFSGQIDELRLSKGIRYDMNNIKSPPSGPFYPDADTIALYHFDEPPGSVVARDSSGSGLDLHFTGPRFSFNAPVPTPTVTPTPPPPQPTATPTPWLSNPVAFPPYKPITGAECIGTGQGEIGNHSKLNNFRFRYDFDRDSMPDCWTSYDPPSIQHGIRDAGLKYYGIWTDERPNAYTYRIDGTGMFRQTISVPIPPSAWRMDFYVVNPRPIGTPARDFRARLIFTDTSENYDEVLDLGVLTTEGFSCNHVCDGFRVQGCVPPEIARKSCSSFGDLDGNPNTPQQAVLKNWFIDYKYIRPNLTTYDLVTVEFFVPPSNIDTPVYFMHIGLERR